MTRSRFSCAVLVVGFVVLTVLGCSAPEGTGVAADPAESQVVDAVLPPPEPDCGNEALTAFDGLLVLAPHPDDEVLGFAGLIRSYLDHGKPVEIVVVTDGDAYCEACRFWKNGTVAGPICDAADFSNLSTEAVDSFAEVRRGESAEALEILGVDGATFLGYPDTEVATAWEHYQAGEVSIPLRRSDFSACADCSTCEGGYGEGPETDLTVTTLMESLRERIAGVSDRTLIATTHRLDGHVDHAALGELAAYLNGELESPRTIAFTLIHAHTPKDTSHPDCWYPQPAAVDCACVDEERAGEDPELVARLRSHRYRPDWPGALPDDADYGEAIHLCLADEVYRGDDAVKLRAINAYGSQLGFSARQGEIAPELLGLMDCSGYLLSFVRRTEAFVLSSPVDRVAGAG